MCYVFFYVPNVADTLSCLLVLFEQTRVDDDHQAYDTSLSMYMRLVLIWFGRPALKQGGGRWWEVVVVVVVATTGSTVLLHDPRRDWGRTEALSPLFLFVGRPRGLRARQRPACGGVRVHARFAPAAPRPVASASRPARPHLAHEQR